MAETNKQGPTPAGTREKLEGKRETEMAGCGLAANSGGSGSPDQVGRHGKQGNSWLAAHAQHGVWTA